MSLYTSVETFTYVRMSYSSISTDELSTFLDDIPRNIDHDTQTDFKRLLLHLFGLTKYKLEAVEQDPDARVIALVHRLFGAIELVLSRKKHLINTQLSLSDTTPLGRAQSGPLYEWGLIFALDWLVRFPRVDLATNAVKLFVFGLINITAVLLHSFKYIADMKSRLMGVFEDWLAQLVAALSARQPVSMAILFALVHLFLIVNDYDISHKLHLHLPSSRLHLESAAKKLWFVLASVPDVLDLLKAVLILNFTSNIVLDEIAPWTTVEVVVSWLNETLKTPAPHSALESWCLCTLRLFVCCREREMLSSLMASLRTTDLLAGNVDPLVAQTLHLVVYLYNVSLESDAVVAEYHLGDLNQYIVKPFDDDLLAAARTQVLGKSHDSILHFIVPDALAYTPPPLLIEARPDLTHWLNYLKNFLHKDREADYRYTTAGTIYTLLSALGRVGCIASGDFHFEEAQCIQCDLVKPNVVPTRRRVTDHSDMSVCYSLLRDLMGHPLFKRPLILSNYLLSLHRTFTSFAPPAGAVAQDPVFQFVLQQTTHHNRDVRLAAARILPLYLVQPKDELLEANFTTVFSHLSKIRFDADSNNLHFAESTIKALSDVAIVSDGERLCVIFIRLVDLLSEYNDQHVNLTYNAFLYIASNKAMTPYKMMAPFLPSIAERIVKKPRLLQRLTELLGISRAFFLHRTREYTTPRFLEYYKHDYIQEIADASNTTKWKLIAKNLPRIIATYLVKDETIDEAYIMRVLGNASPEYKALKMADLITSVGEILWFILLQMQVDASGRILNESRITNALVYVAKINMKRSGDTTRREKGFDYVKYLLGEHVLELVQRFSENVHHIKGTKPYLEKTSSLKAIEYLISKNIGAATSALGQISTCLQATLENPDFELLAIRCWSVLVKNLRTNHLISLFDIIISLIFQKFPTLEHRLKLVAVEILERLFKELNNYDKYALYYLSVVSVENLDQYFSSSGLRHLKPKNKSTYLPEFSRRLKTTNNYVVKQALDDLIYFTSKFQLNCQADDFRDPLLNTAVSDLIRTLLDTAVHFRGKDTKITTSCAKSLSVIGALDMNRFNFKTIKSQTIVLHDFTDYRENATFLRHFIESHVLRVFWASNDPIKQLFSAYSMQKFLEVLKLDPRVLTPTTQDVFTDVWNKFSDIAKSTLTPLLSSKYVSPQPRYEPMKFPYYRSSMKHEKWLVDFTSNLLRRPSADDSPKVVIFQTCAMLIRDQDIQTCHYLLKYITLSYIISDDDVVENIKGEFLHILSMEVSTGDRLELLKACYQSIFEVLDYFNEWLSATTQFVSDHAVSKAETTRLNRSLARVKAFLDSIPTEVVAAKLAECDSYERTILYLDKCFRDGVLAADDKVTDTSVVATLQSMYANINDYDALDGMLKRFSTNNLKQKLKTFQYNENWAIKHESFQVLSQGNNVENVTKLLKSLSEHALYDEVLSTLQAKTTNTDNIPSEWTSVGLQAAVCSGEPKEIDKWLVMVTSQGRIHDIDTLISYKFGQALRSLHNRPKFSQLMDEMYEVIGGSLMSLLASSFSRNSGLLSQLHTMYDTTLIAESDEVMEAQDEMILRERLGNIDQAFESQWKVLSMHRVVNQLRGKKEKTSDILLHLSKVARQNGRLDISTRCIMKAMMLDDQGANVEYTELLWAQGKQTEAIKSLHELILDDNFKSDRLKAEAQLQYAKWLDSSNHSSSTTIISEYTKAYKIELSWERPYYELGKYYSKVMESRDDSSGYYEQQILRFFLKALALGPSYIFEALPKFITIWLDFAQTRRSKEAERKLNQIIQDIKTYANSIPVYVWYTSITQMLSRIGHQHVASVQLLVQIITKMGEAYPKHSLWYILSHLNSNDKVRKERVGKVLHNLELSDEKLARSIVSAKELFNTLISIVKFKISRKSAHKLSLAKDFGINNLVNPYSSLVIPVRLNLEIRLPSKRHLHESTAFPRSSTITFDGFDDVVNIFHSLQMPRQVTIRGSDYRPYRVMLKKDDTRKDAKVVEFTTMINRLLSASTEARKRKLLIPNYSVIPLAENMGVIEFVLDVSTMKAVIHDVRKRLGKIPNDRKIFMKLDEAQKALKLKTLDSSAAASSLGKLVSLFKSICEEYPPVLHQWYVQQFPDPASWYIARNQFTRSVAVMSIVGYIIGLGDRHCENILFFKKTGGVLHIDFDCLFEKGRTLPTPEIVPFRLTQNMVDAMGITGIEGTFRITCEVTGSLVRDNEAPLMNILETLLYDPLLDWKTQQNQDHLKKVRRKIRGLVDEQEGLPMNIHGQVDMLIQEAASAENLSRMYGGWAPYV